MEITYDVFTLSRRYLGKVVFYKNRNLLLTKYAISKPMNPSGARLNLFVFTNGSFYDNSGIIQLFEFNGVPCMRACAIVDLIVPLHQVKWKSIRTCFY